MALALHAGALAVLMVWPGRTVDGPPGEQEITIDLAPAMEATEALAPAEASSPAEATGVQPPEPITAGTPPDPTNLAEAPAPQASEVVPPAEIAAVVPADAVPVEAEPASAPEVIAALPPPEETVAEMVEEKPAPKPVRPHPPKKIERKPPTPRTAAPEQRTAPSVPHRGRASSSRENTGGAAASADPTVFDRYAAQVAAALRGRLRYPEAARSQGISGVATIRFTMQRSGRVFGTSLVRSSGSAILDEAALATAAPGTSLPPAPDAVPQQQLTFSVPLRFSFR